MTVQVADEQKMHKLMADNADEINMDEMLDLLEELKEIYDTLREEYNTENATKDVKTDFVSLDAMFSKFFGFSEVSLNEYLENLSDFTTGLHYLELDLEPASIDQLKLTKYMVLLNNFSNRCIYKYHGLFHTSK